MSGATDPHNWLLPGASPGSVFAKIVNTSRENLNGQVVAVLVYQESNGRYVVHMTTSQNQALMKPENLVRATWMEQMRGQYELVRNHPDVQRQLRDFYNLVRQKTGIDPTYVAILFGILLLLVIYFVGFSKTIMTVSMILLLSMVIAPDWGSPWSVVLQNFPMRARDVIRKQIPVLGPRIADNYYLSMACVAVVFFAFLQALIYVPPAATPTSSSSTWTPNAVQPHVARTTTTTTTAPDRILLEDYYKKGFEDGQAGKVYGTSLPIAVQPVEEKLPDLDEFDFPPPPPPPPPVVKKSWGGRSGPLDWSSILSLMYMGRTVYSLGAHPDGGWDWQLALANVRIMDPMRLGFLALSLFRLGTTLFRFASSSS